MKNVAYFRSIILITLNFNRIETDIGVIHYCEGTKPTELSKRDFQTQIIQALVNEAGYASHSIEHKPSGQPYFDGDNMPNVSVSHSDNYGAIYIGKAAVGVDIQTFHPRIAAGKDYFINSNEIQFDTSLELHLIWAAKEVVFKSLGGFLGDARQEVTIMKIDFDTLTAHAKIGGNLRKVGFIHTQTFVLAYSLD